MKTYYTTFIISLMALLCTAQGYEFGIVHISNYDFKIVAIPNFDSAGDTDVADVGFTLMLPAGNADVTNITSVLGGKPTVLNDVLDATGLNALSLGDGTRDLFFLVLSNVPSAIFSHTNGQQIDLLSFQVSNMPVSGEISILLNNDPIAIGLVTSVDSFYNSNIDATTTQDYFSGLASGMESFDFSILGIEDNLLLNSINVYPNPASDIIYISSSINIEAIKMFDVLGKQVLTSYENKELKVDHLQSGIYFLKLFTNNGSATKKIIIE